MKPILFNTEMTKAILENRKTVTRRVVKPRSRKACGFCVARNKQDGLVSGVYDCYEDGQMFDAPQKPPYRPSDILYVRETWAAWSRTLGISPALYYKADGNAPNGIKWHPSIHMPREAARIFLRVTDVRVERLQDITSEDIVKEGFSEVFPAGIWQADFYNE